MSSRYLILPIGPLSGRLRAPSSKSETNRALLLAALADGESTISTPLRSDDTERMTDCLECLGAGARIPGVSIANLDCVAKTYPRFWDDAQSLGFRIG